MKLSLLTKHPRLPRLLVTRALAASLALGGCVPATQYEQANSAAEVEREGHRRAVAELNAAQEELKRIKAENEALTAHKSEIESQLSEEETAHAQASLDMQSAKKEREQQAELVTQLRGELARIGGHLKTYEGDKDLLQEKLLAAEGQVKLLESQIEYLRSKQETSEDAQQKLRGALADLEAMQGESAGETSEPSEETAKPTDAADEPTDEDAGTEEPTGEDTHSEAPTGEDADEAPEEVLPEEDPSDDN